MDFPLKTKTRGGSTAIVFGNLSVGKKPLVGVYYDGVSEWIPVSWTELGEYFDATQKTGLDVIIVV